MQTVRRTWCVAPTCRPPTDVLAGASLRQLRISGGDGYATRLNAVGLTRIRLAQVSPLGSVALLEQVAGGHVGCTLAQGDEIARARQRMPMLKAGAAVGPPGGIGWVLRNHATTPWPSR